MKRRVFVIIGIAALMALAVVWFRANYERVPTKEWVGASGEARLRHFLAAERFAGRMGWKAGELRSLPELDTLPTGGVLLLPNRRQALDQARMAEILRWVERGGHLIAEAEYLGVPDPLFDLLKVKRADAPPAVKPLSAEAPARRSSRGAAAGGRPLSVAMHEPMKLELGAHDARVWAGTRETARLASFDRGSGIVTVATGLHFARNRAIGANDHAELLWHLLALTQGREMKVYWSPARLSLWGFLTENAAPALAASALLLALWL